MLVLHGDGRCLGAACLREPRHAGRFVLLEPPTLKGKVLTRTLTLTLTLTSRARC